MPKTMIVNDEDWWKIRDAQTILEKKGKKLTLPEILSVAIPNPEDIVRKYEMKE